MAVYSISIFVVIVVAVFFGDRLEAAEKAVALVIGPSCEVKSVGQTTSPVVAELESPEAINDDWTFVYTLEQTFEVSVGFEGHDGPTTEVPYQELIAMFAETLGSES